MLFLICLKISQKNKSATLTSNRLIIKPLFYVKFYSKGSFKHVYFVEVIGLEPMSIKPCPSTFTRFVLSVTFSGCLFGKVT